MKSEIQQHADFTKVRYANCWEDADILIEALDPVNRHCLSIGSAGDNSFSLLAAGASQVTVSEMNPAQIACIKLRIAAYQTLDHSEFLSLLGENEADAEERTALYKKCEPLLNQSTKSYWKHFICDIENGFGRIGKFEKYFSLFRTKLLPFVHSKKSVTALLSPRSQAERKSFYEQKWDSWRWQLLFQLFFSRTVMGRLGRDPAFFKYVEGSVADRILMRTEHALTQLDPSTNPYLHWILTGKYGKSLPHALRKENYQKIQNNLDHLSIDSRPIEAVIKESNHRYDAFNLSDIFEYMSVENTAQLLSSIATGSNPGARLAYWNMLAPRSRPDNLSHQIKSLPSLSQKLFNQDKAFFYSAFIVEESI